MLHTGHYWPADNTFSRMNNPAFQVDRLAFLLMIPVLNPMLLVTLTLTIPPPTRVMMTSPKEILAWSYRVLQLERTKQRE